MLKLRLFDTCLERLLMVFTGTGIFLGGLEGLMLAGEVAGQGLYYVTVILYRRSDPGVRCVI